MKRFLWRLTVFGFFVAGINLVFAYFYEKPIRQAIADKTHKNSLKFEAIHNHPRAYDLIFLGSSRAYCAYNPEIFNARLNIRSHNMGTGSQNTIESYYILRDLLKFQRPRCIVYEMFLPSFEQPNDYYQILSNAGFLHAFADRQEMIFRGFGVEGVLNAFIPVLRHRMYIRNDISDFIFRRGRTRPQEARKWISGYLYDARVAGADAISDFQGLDRLNSQNLSDKKLQYFMDLVALCRTYRITLICVRAPYPPTVMEKTPQDDEGAYFRQICESRHIPFYDFNRRDSSTIQNTDFSDERHLNVSGAGKVSAHLADILARTGALASLPLQGP